MSEFNPFGASEEAPLAVAEAAEESSSKRNVIALGALAAVVVAGGAFLFLGGGGDEEEVEAFVPRAKPAQAAAPAAAPPPAAKLPPPSKAKLGRNPFKALYVAPAAAAAPAAGTSTGTTTATTTSGGTTQIVVGGTAPSGSTGTAPTTGTEKPAPAQSTLSLKSVKEGDPVTATFVYDGKELTGKVGDVLAGKLLVKSIKKSSSGTWYSYLQLGDGAPFEVHKGQTIVVQ